jgi:hypothetical protein
VRAGGADQPSCPRFLTTNPKAEGNYNMDEQEIARLWESETTLWAPHSATILRWLTIAPAEDVAAAIKKTARAVRKAAGTDRPFVIGNAVSYTSNILNNASAQRSAVVQAAR